MEIYTRDDHDAAVARIAIQVQAYHVAQTAFRINHGSSNTTRSRGVSESYITISQLQHILHVSAESNTALVEPNVALDTLIEATLPLQRMPPVVMEFPGITVGGGFSGASGESSSFRHGLFDCTVNWIEMLLADGRVVRAWRRGKNQDLFHAARCGLGTLGIVTLLEVALVPAKEYVRCTYQPVTSGKDMVQALRNSCSEPELDFVEAIMFHKTEGVVVRGWMSSGTEEQLPVHRFSRAWDSWFYEHAYQFSQKLKWHAELVPIRDYLFRYDRGAYWTGASLFGYFGLPSTSLTRWILDPLLHARELVHAMTVSESAAEDVVQDLIVPAEKAEEMVEWLAVEVGVWPLWICPVRRIDMNADMQPFAPATVAGHLALNIGVYGTQSRAADELFALNRHIEAKLQDLAGRKAAIRRQLASQHMGQDEWDMFSLSDTAVDVEAVPAKYLAAGGAVVYLQCVSEELRRMKSGRECPLNVIIGRISSRSKRECKEYGR
ncbi:hypothetical protein FH972_024064 [Carpinus fangiana]|uniref:Delta(24)-sterol reductase n=1 Tax=Carpinus fangiana TaxID=176857 RepID=A0A5N6KXD1_9ROSI|nr:hypothetical protein FH972_024064 [Carpinus fangiana]